MQTSGRRKARWLLYVLECSDGTYYTGITNDLDRRMENHNAGTASRYTRSRLPVSLVHTEGCLNKSSALKKELRIKALTRQEKEEYLATNAGKTVRMSRGIKSRSRSRTR